MKTQRTRWTAAQAARIIDRADEAKSDHSYAVARGIHVQRIASWRKRLGRPRRKAASASARPALAFVEVKPRPPTASTMIEVVLANGRQLRVSDQVAPVVLAQLADALEGRC